MSDIGIVVQMTPRLLGEIVLSALASEKDLRVLGAVDSEEHLLDLCDRVRPDVVVVAAADAELEAMGRRVLMRCPSIKLFALAADGLKTCCSSSVPTGWTWASCRRTAWRGWCAKAFAPLRNRPHDRG